MALTSLPSISYSSRDFEAIRASLIDHVKLYFPNDWSDFIESDLGVCILELMAYVGDQLHFYLDRVSNEAFLPTATQRSSVINLASTLGYVPRTTAAASAPLRIRLNAQSDSTVISAYTNFTDNGGEPWEILVNVEIPAGRTDTFAIEEDDEVLGTGDGTTTSYSLTTDNENLVEGSFQISFTINSSLYTVTAGSDGSITIPFGGSGIIDFDTGEITLVFRTGFEPDAATDILASYTWNQNVVAFQGRTRLEQFTSDATASQSFVLTNTPVLVSPLVENEVISPNPNRFEVWVGDPGSPFGNGTGVLWTRVDSLVSAAPADEVYALRLDDQDRVIIDFGDDLAGAIPPSATINVIYRTGGGTKGNVAVNYISASITGSSGLLSVTCQINNFEKATGGAERESLDEIRVNAPAFLRTNDTATTESDFNTLAIFSRAGLGSITRASSRLTPSESIVTRTIHTSVVLETVPVGTPTTYYLLLPATPIELDTVTVTYEVAGVVRIVTPNDLGNNTADLSGSSTIDQAATIFRYDEQDFSQEVPGGFSGDGTEVVFSGTLLGYPVFPGSVIFRYTSGGEDYVGYDDGNGMLAGTGVNSTDSTIDYTTGDIELFFGTQASRTNLNDETYDLDNIAGGSDTTLLVAIDGTPAQTITFSSGDFSDYTACTAAEIASIIDMNIVGASASAASGRVTITSDSYGDSSSVNITGGTANDAVDGLNFQTGASNGTGSPPDAASVISFDYQSCLKLVLNTAPDEGTDINISMESGPSIVEFPTNNVEVYTWSQDSEGNFIPPSSSLRGSLKSYLDLRRVLGTSVEVLPGKTMQVHYYLTVTFDPAVDQAETRATIVENIQEAFSSVVNVAAGNDVPLSLIYDALTPLPLGVIDVVVQDVGIRVPVGIGNGILSVFKNSPDLVPGKHVSSGKLPAVPGSGLISVYIDDEQVGTSNASTPTASLSTVSGATYSILSGSVFNVNTGAFTIKVSPAPAINSMIYLDFLLNEQASDLGMALWNVVVESWEMAQIGNISINGSIAL